MISVAVEGLANKLTYIDKLQPDDPDQPKLVAIIKHKLSILQKDVRAQLRSPEFGEVMRELDAQLTNGLEEIKPLNHSNHSNNSNDSNIQMTTSDMPNRPASYFSRPSSEPGK